jgi:2-oxoisovalerate dehydrogenase E1 component alpha subunit
MYAISEPVEKEMAVKSAAEKACGLGLPGVQVDGTDLFATYETMCEAVERARSGGGPTLVEARMYRMTPHSSDDDDRAYRSREEVEEHKKFDPMLVAHNQLEKNGALDPDRLDEMEKRARELIDAAVQYAEAAPYPSEDEATYPVYAEEVRHA